MQRKKPRLLCVLPYVPAPADSGGTQRTLALIKALDEAFSVTVFALLNGNGNPATFRAVLSGRVRVVNPAARFLWRATAAPRALASGAPFRYWRYASPPVRAALEELLRAERFDAIHFDHLHMGQLLPLARKLRPDAWIVLDEHNIEARAVETFASLLPRPQRKLLQHQARRVLALERRVVAQADATLACSHENAEELRRLGARCVEVIPNGIRREVDGRASDNDRRMLIFVGSFNWLPNLDAARRLTLHIWPRARDAIPGAKLAIVGQMPPRHLRAFSSERVLITGRVDSVSPFLRASRATAIPLRAGSGTRIKILEAWAHGVPVVASRLALEGLDYIDGRNVLLAEGDQEFADAIVRVWHDSDLAGELTRAGLQTAAQYDQGAIGRRLVSLYEAWLSAGERSDEVPSALPYTQPAYSSATARTE